MERVIYQKKIQNKRGEVEDYLNSLRTMFDNCQKREIDVIFMTPNMLNTYVADDVVEKYIDYARVTAEYQNEGRMDLYMNSAVTLARNMGVKVADCYKKWKELAKMQDTTLLLANKINHPIRGMHELFANTLFNVIMKEKRQKRGGTEDGMYQ